MAIKRAHGIDISIWQEKLVPRPQNNTDIDFVVIKASQSNWADPNFEDHYSSAQSYSIRGAYHYFHTLTTFGSRLGPVDPGVNTRKMQEKKGGAKAIAKEMTTIQTFTENGPGWKEQADFFLSQVQGKDFQFFALDVEKGRDPKEKAGRTQNVFTRADVVNIKSWINYVMEKTGKKVLLYTNQDIYKSILLPNGGQILAEFDLWLAGYPFAPKRDEDDPISIYRVPGVDNWRLWQYSADGNMKGPAYGVRSSSIDLNVFNGSIEEMMAWLDLDAGEMRGVLGQQDKKPADGRTLKPGKSLMRDTLAQLEKIKQAGLAPVVQINLHQDEFDLDWIQNLKEKLKDMGIPVEVLVNIQVPWGVDGGEAGGTDAGSTDAKGSGDAGSHPKNTSPTGTTGKPPAPVETVDSFSVVVISEKSVVQGFKQRDKAGKPIMIPHDPRIKLFKGARLKVSSKHKESTKDAGDGTIRGTGEGNLYYCITEYAADPGAKGLFVKQEDVRRV